MLPSMYHFVNDESSNIRTKQTHPYSYDPITQFRAPIKPGHEASSVYTDRLVQWDYKKHNQLCTKHFGNVSQYWDSREPKLIEAFLRDWLENQDLQLIQIIEYCNQSTGYPVWRLDYATPANKGDKGETRTSKN